MPPRLEPDSETERVHFLASRTLVERVDAWRSQQAGGLKKGEAFRALVERALESEEAVKKTQRG